MSLGSLLQCYSWGGGAPTPSTPHTPTFAHCRGVSSQNKWQDSLLPQFWVLRGGGALGGSLDPAIPGAASLGFPTQGVPTMQAAALRGWALLRTERERMGRPLPGRPQASSAPFPNPRPPGLDVENSGRVTEGGPRLALGACGPHSRGCLSLSGPLPYRPPQWWAGHTLNLWSAMPLPTEPERAETTAYDPAAMRTPRGPRREGAGC